MIEIKTAQDFEKFVNSLPPEIIRKIHRSTLNKGIRGAAAAVEKETRQHYNIKAGALRAKNDAYNSKKVDLASIKRPEAMVSWIARTISLTRFEPIQVSVNRRKGTTTTTRRRGNSFNYPQTTKKSKAGKATGVSVKLTNQGRKVVKGAWLGRSKQNGVMLIFKRKPGEFAADGKEKVVPKFAPSVSQMVDHEESVEVFDTYVERKLPETFLHETNFFLNKALNSK